MQEKDIVNRYQQAIVVILLPIYFAVGLTRCRNMRYALKARLLIEVLVWLDQNKYAQ